MKNFTVFREYLEALEHRKKRLSLGRVSLRADFLKNRCTGIGIEFKDLMQADFVIYLRSELTSDDPYDRWWPETLVYLGHFSGAFEIFLRSVSKKYFDKMKIVLGIEEQSKLADLMQSFGRGERTAPRWDYQSINPAELAGVANLASRP